MGDTGAQAGAEPAQRITDYIAELGGWRGAWLTELRALIREVTPEIVEEWKWGTPVWSHGGNVVAAGAFKDHVKLNFFKGAALDDPAGLFNAGLEAKASRAIDMREGDAVDAQALRALIAAAVALNSGERRAQRR